MSNVKERKAVLFSQVKPEEKQWEGFRRFVTEKYGADMPLEWEETDAFPGGFRIEVGSEVYDWSVNGRFRQLRDTLSRVPKANGNVLPLLREAVATWTPEVKAEELGVVKSVGDGIATITGLDNVTYGEILMFSNGVKGMAQELREHEIGCILFEGCEDITEGESVYRTGKTAGVPVGTDFLGRVVNSLGAPIDGGPPIESHGYNMIESPAPGIIDRQPVHEPMETGILAIDAMFPIGRGQRELIIGDRQTGKTAIAIDTILNQRGKDVVCVYVAIGQKASSVVQIAETLKQHGAMDHTVIVCATASDPAPLQYIAPYAGCAIGEYFMNMGLHVLIIYDDLSKHAVAYRSISLLLNRPPGREAYPGDVFYLHSRLLERSACLSEERGGGSMTALPIVETQAGDVSAYIPTNIISITDGQLFLESDLFFSGHRPAVNVGLSVSRVGSAAQTKAMKKAAGTIRLDLAQFREIEVFTQFASDLDDITKRQLAYGQSLMRILRQPQSSPYKQHEQVILLTAGLGHAMEAIPPTLIAEFVRTMLATFEMDQHDLCSRIDSTGQLSDEDKEVIITQAKALAESFLRLRKEKKDA